MFCESGTICFAVYNYQKDSEVLLMAMFHCTDKKIALKGNLADYINKRTGFMMNPVFYLYLKTI